ncbi:MAG: MFS transporter [Chloroflexi bacterium]|nr:MFS transporter [Chloroflexota bacterium]
MARFFNIPPEAENDPATPYIKRNFIVNTLDTMAFNFGDTFAAAQTILPVFASTLTSSTVLIGLVPAINDAGWYLPQLFFAPLLERVQQRLPLVRWMALIERVPFLLMIFAALWLPTLKGDAAIWLFLLLIAFKGLSAGMVGLPWQELIATLIPVWLRGRFFGISQFLGKLMGLGGSALAAVILSRYAYPNNYSMLFVLAFIGVMLSWVFLCLSKEPPSVERVSDPAAVKTAFSEQLWSILKEDRNFRRYILSRSMCYLGNMAVSFVAVYGIQRFNLPDAYAAIFTSVLVGFQTIGFIVWGGVGDRFGNKLVLMGSAVLWILALVLLLTIPAQWGLYLAFALLGLAQPGNTIGDLNMAMEFDSGPRRPSYIGLARTLTAPMLLLAPVMAGAVAGWTGYPAMFLLSLIFSVLGLMLLSLTVTDPRKVKTCD